MRLKWFRGDLAALDASTRLRLLLAVVALGLGAGMLLSPHLWTSLREFPVVPVIALPATAALVVEVVALVLLTVALLALIVQPRLGWAALAVGALALLCLLDQMRLQPWVPQYAALLLLAGLGLNAAAVDQPRALNACGLVLAATYFWSGVQKLNPPFRTELIPWFTAPAAHWLGLAHLPAWFGYACPWTEILLAVALLFPRTRLVGLLGIIGVHGFALLMLGPLGHNWNVVVWPWNIAQAMACGLIFWRNPDGALQFIPALAGPLRRDALRLAHAAAVVLFGLLPALSFFGLWDSFASMALYSENTASGRLICTDGARDCLPSSARSVSTRSGDSWCVDIYGWAYASLNVPTYPEPRIYYAVARELCRRSHCGDGLKLELHTRPTLSTPAEKYYVNPKLYAP